MRESACALATQHCSSSFHHPARTTESHAPLRKAPCRSPLCAAPSAPEPGSASLECQLRSALLGASQLDAQHRGGRPAAPAAQLPSAGDMALVAALLGPGRGWAPPSEGEALPATASAAAPYNPVAVSELFARLAGGAGDESEPAGPSGRPALPYAGVQRLTVAEAWTQCLRALLPGAQGGGARLALLRRQLGELLDMVGPAGGMAGGRAVSCRSALRTCPQCGAQPCRLLGCGPRR